MERLRAAAEGAGRTVTAVPLPGVTHVGRDAETGVSRLDVAAETIVPFLERHVPVPDPVARPVDGERGAGPGPHADVDREPAVSGG
jgi:hypothetical protein